jgi:hypothetical protein
VLATSEAESSGHQVEAQATAEAPFMIHGYALCTRSCCQQLVYNQVAAEGFQAFLLKIEV